MVLTKSRLASAFAAGTAAAVAAALALMLPASAHAATTSLCGATSTASASGGSYIVQNNEWGSSASECITTDGGNDFAVANSSIANSTSGAPGGYPSIYKGCHWGDCSSGSGFPVQVSAINPGTVTTSWNTSQPGGSNDYDVAYDIWFNQAPTTAGQPNGLEMMIWLNHNGPVQPFGGTVASNASIGGTSYNVWEGAQSSWSTVSYTMDTGSTSVSNLDLYSLVQDSINRGYLQKSWYLIDVEAGFELWQGGAGLATNSFSVNVGGTSTGQPSTSPSSSPSMSASPSHSPSSSPSSSPTQPSGGGGCTAAYTVTSSWPGGFQGQVVVSAGSSAISGWKVGWTFPSAATINSLWNGAYTQSGNSVTVSNMNYNGSVGAGASTSFGFTATDSGSSAPSPSSVSCTAS